MLEKFVIKSRLIDMLDFSRNDFSKSIGLSPKKNVKIVFLENLHKYQKEKLSFLATTNPSRHEISKVAPNTIVSFIEMSSVSNNGYIEYKEDKVLKELKSGGFTYFQEGDILIAKITPSMENGKCAIAENLTNKIGMGSTEFHVIRVNEKILNYYLFTILNNNEIRVEAEKQMTGASGHRRVPIEFYENLQIPLPPIAIQNNIVQECKKIDNEIKKAQTNIIESKQKIENNFKDVFSTANKTYKLSDEKMFHVFIGRRVLQKEIEDQAKGIPVYSANVFEPFGTIDKEFIKDFSLPSVLWGIDGDWMVNYIEANKPFYPTDHCGVIRVKGKEVHPRYLAWVLHREGEAVRFSRTHRASTDRVKGISIKAPSFAEQESLVKKIQKLEDEIKKAELIVESASEKKQDILKKYL